MSDFDTEQHVCLMQRALRHESLMQKALRHTKKAKCLMKGDLY